MIVAVLFPSSGSGLSTWKSVSQRILHQSQGLTYHHDLQSFLRKHWSYCKSIPSVNQAFQEGTAPAKDAEDSAVVSMIFKSTLEQVRSFRCVEYDVEHP